jgi:hypothetical protein
MIVLRRDHKVTDNIKVRIIPGKRATAAETEKLKQFKPSREDPSRLAELIEEATRYMGLTKRGSSDYKKFSHHTLQIEITGPDRPMLYVC